MSAPSLQLLSEKLERLPLDMLLHINGTNVTFVEARLHHNIIKTHPSMLIYHWIFEINDEYPQNISGNRKNEGIEVMWKN